MNALRTRETKRDIAATIRAYDIMSGRERNHQMTLAEAEYDYAGYEAAKRLLNQRILPPEVYDAELKKIIERYRV